MNYEWQNHPQYVFSPHTLLITEDPFHIPRTTLKMRKVSCLFAPWIFQYGGTPCQLIKYKLLTWRYPQIVCAAQIVPLISGRRGRGSKAPFLRKSWETFKGSYIQRFYHPAGISALVNFKPAVSRAAISETGIKSRPHGKSKKQIPFLCGKQKIPPNRDK